MSPSTVLVIAAFLMILDGFWLFLMKAKLDSLKEDILGELSRHLKVQTITDSPKKVSDESRVLNVRISKKFSQQLTGSLTKSLYRAFKPLTEQLENTVVEQTQQLTMCLEELASEINQTFKGVDEDEIERDLDNQADAFLREHKKPWKEQMGQVFEPPKDILSKSEFEKLATCSAIPPILGGLFSSINPPIQNPTPKRDLIPIDYSGAGECLDALTTDIQPGAIDPDSRPESEFEEVVFDMGEFENPNDSPDSEEVSQNDAPAY